MVHLIIPESFKTSHWMDYVSAFRKTSDTGSIFTTRHTSTSSSPFRKKPAPSAGNVDLITLLIKRMKSLLVLRFWMKGGKMESITTEIFEFESRSICHKIKSNFHICSIWGIGVRCGALLYRIIPLLNDSAADRPQFFYSLPFQ